MPDLGILDTLIAMAIVILTLCLVVQSIQTLVKKLFKLKSLSIIHSLEDLFETITNRPSTAAAADTELNWRSILNFLKDLFEKITKRQSTPAVAPGTQLKTPQQLVADVTNRLKGMGRKTLFGYPMLDSLAKGDLLKVLTRVKAEDLLPGAVGNFQTVLAGINELKDEIATIDTTLLQGESSAKFAAMQGSIMPLLHDLEALASGGNIDPAVFFGDLYRVRQIKAAEVLDILGHVQQGVSKDVEAAQAARDEARKALAAAQQSNNQDQIKAANEQHQAATGALTAVTAVDSGLKRIANQIAALSNTFDAAFAPLFARLQQVEVWYDTVMQGFQERFTRHMKTIGILISIGVVIILNANIFSVYRAIKSDPATTALIVKQGPAIIKTAQEANEKKQAANPSASPTVTTSPSPADSSSAAPLSAESPARTAAPAGATPQPSPAPTESPTTLADLDKEVKTTDELAKTYQSFGMKPLSRQQLSDVWKGNYLWRDLVETLLGWAIMVMLLSAGAPFWEDTLESLFGLKGLLRQKSDTKNIEDEKGGQPKP